MKGESWRTDQSASGFAFSGGAARGAGGIVRSLDIRISPERPHSMFFAVIQALFPG
jgi:hypothetical protein